MSSNGRFGATSNDGIDSYLFHLSTWTGFCAGRGKPSPSVHRISTSLQISLTLTSCMPMDLNNAMLGALSSPIFTRKFRDCRGRPRLGAEGDDLAAGAGVGDVDA